MAKILSIREASFGTDTVPTPAFIGPYKVTTVVAIGAGAVALVAALYYALRK